MRHERLETRALLTASPWTNPINPLDVTGDGEVGPHDALNIINRLSLADAAQTNDLENLIAPPILGQYDNRDSSLHFDPTGDGQLSARDALYIINGLGTGDASTSIPEDVPEQSDTFEESSHMLAVIDDYMVQQGKLADSSDRDVFRFYANKSRVAVDLSALEDDESMAEIRVLDSSLNEITRGSHRRGRSAYEGFDFEAELGEEYFVVVDSDSEVTEFYYTVEVYQFEPEQWESPSDSNAGSDMHGDDADAATELEFADGFARISSHIDADEDADSFKIVAEQDRVSFELIGLSPAEFSANLNLTNEAGDVLVPINRLGGAYTVAVEPGDQVYAQVTGLGSQVGQYILDVHQFENTDQFRDLDSDVLENATQLTVRGEGLEIYRKIDSPTDVDVFQFTVPSSDKDAFISVGGYGQFAAVDFEVLDQNGNVVERSETNTFEEVDFLGTYPVQVNDEYYIRVFEPDGLLGEYILTLGFVDKSDSDRASQPDSTLGNDLHAATLDDASALEFSQGKVVSNIDFAGDVDVFKIPVKKSDTLLAITGVSVSIDVLDPTGATIDPIRRITADGELQGGTFPVGDASYIYARVEGATPSEYILEFQSTDEDDIDPTIEITPDSDLDDGTNLVRLEFNSADDVDVFQIVAERPLLHLLVRGDSFSDASVVDIGVELLNSQGEPIAGRRLVDESVPVSIRNSFEYDLEIGQEYFIRATNGTGGPIATNLHVRQLGVDDGDLHGGTITSATQITVLPGLHGINGVKGRLTPDDRDVFEIVGASPFVGGNDFLSVDVRPTEIPEDPDFAARIRIEIFDQDGELIYDDSKPQDNVLIDLRDGWRYFARISTATTEPLDYLFGTVWITNRDR